jgi:predicted ribosome quality control (RQC) complex YloA/Tae2 family protein
MKEIQLSNLALKHLVEENQLLVNGFINKVQTTEEGLLKLKIHTKKGDKLLIVTKNAFFISDKRVDAKQNPGGFSAFLKKYLFNQRIISIKQKGLDRIVVIEFPEVRLVLELFAKGNIILLDKEENIMRAMRKEKWKDRTLAMGEKYSFPTSRGISPLEEKEKEFLKKVKENNKTIFGAITEILNVSPGLLETAFEKQNTTKTEQAKSVSEKDAKALLKAIKKIYSKKIETIYLNSGVIYSVETGKEKETEFKSLGDAIETSLTPIRKKTVKKKKKEEVDYGKETKDWEKKEIEFKKTGEYIYLKYNEITEVFEAIKKGKRKGIGAKEIMKQINSVRSTIKELNFEENRVKLKI